MVRQHPQNTTRIRPAFVRLNLAWSAGFLFQQFGESSHSSRRAQLSRVLVPSVSIRAPRRALDGELSRELLAHFRSAVSAAFRNGEAQFAVQAVGAR